MAQYPVRWTAQSALHFLPSLTDLFNPTPFSASPGSILAMQQLRAKTKSLTFPPLSIARYSFIQLSRQGRQWREGKCPIFQTVAKGDSNPGSLDCESGILPLSYRCPLRHRMIHHASLSSGCHAGPVVANSTDSRAPSDAHSVAFPPSHPHKVREKCLIIPPCKPGIKLVSGQQASYTDKFGGL